MLKKRLITVLTFNDGVLFRTKNFTPDYIPNKYVDKQTDFCNNIGVTPSKTVLFGVDNNNKYPQYNRGGTSNRLSFHRQYIKGLDIASTK